MKIVIRLTKPANEKERLFRAEATVDDLKNPGTAHVSIGGKDYLIEVHFDY